MTLKNLKKKKKKKKKKNLKNDWIVNFAFNQEKRDGNIKQNLLCLILYQKEQGDLLKQLRPGKV